MLVSKGSSPLILLIAVLAAFDITLAQDKYPITGLKTVLDPATGYRPPRRDILELQNDVPQFSLYVQAMNRFMTTNETTLTSYFQVAGIHGRPYIAWDNVNPKQMNVDGFPVGYCTHGNILFGTWHRPYLALIEQIMGEQAQIIARDYNSPIYTKAADELRLPFWDWAKTPQQFPAIMTQPTVQISTPTGTTNVKNPLFRYEFLSVPEREEWFPQSDGVLARLATTVRQPDSNWKSQDQTISDLVATQGSYLTSEVYSIFAKTKDFNAMSTSGNSLGESFESPHGSIHVTLGGSGHMTQVAYAGFDPAFWLHHANVDRQVAMWQAIYPDAWMSPAESPGGTWTIYPNTIVDESTPLTPFTTGDRITPWTSKTARYTKAFGYSYPDVEDWRMTPAELSANVTARVNNLYNPSGTLPSKSKASARFAKRDIAREWSAAVEVSNNAIGEGFAVTLRLGETLVGKTAVFSAPAKEELAAGANKFTYATYTLTEGLREVPDDVGAVQAYVKDNLKWSVSRLSDGSDVSLDQVVGLKVTVVDEIVTLTDDITKFPSWGAKTVHTDLVDQDNKERNQ